MEMKHMGLSHMIKTNVFFRDAYVEGKAEGQSEGEVKGKVDLLLGLLTHKYGRVPAWARERLAGAREADQSLV